ncbi:nucleotidyltransferase family protein [Polyangium aurulentum]|uniref:nucleotidyltransferase family protein n=1 Tax=Polyangium aurulentum TaxID=2567896 RepID=UPI0010AE5758|nr:nucleotidyltransferase family protein [Polyangium aurulentum]UQA54697.1 nucleotidyltransferase family protein [Polyangium aurulentum]
MMETVAVVLAAGKGARLGGPKALLRWSAGGKPRPLAMAHAEARLGADCTRVLIVARKPVVQALISFVVPGIDLLVSTAPDEQGPAGSIATAAGRLGAAERVLVFPVDTVPAKAATVASLFARLGTGGAAPLAVRPRHGGRGGHPVALQAKALERYREPNPPPLRDHLQALGDACVDEDVDDPDVLVDFDTPSEAMRVLRTPVAFFGADGK